MISAHCADVRWQRVEVSHENGVTDHLAWNAYNVDRLQVIGCKFGIGGLQLSLCDDFVINNNFWDAQYLNTNEPCHISTQSSGVFTNNTVTNTATDAVDLYSSGHRCVVANNRFIGLRGGAGLECKVTMSDIPGNSSSPGNVFESTVIANNVFRDFNGSVTSTRTGIYASYVDSRAAPAFAIAEANRGIIITGNILADFNETDPGNGAIVSYQAIVFHGSNGIVANNIVRNMRAWNAATPVGIALFSENADVTAGAKCIGVTVQGNNIAGLEGVTSYGIRAGNLDYCNITGNTIRTDDVAGRSPKYGIGITNGASLNHCRISDNIIQCNQTNAQAIVATSTTTTFTECDISGNMIRDCGISIYKAIRCSFTNNTFNNATNGGAFNLGIAGVTCLDIRIIGNHFTMNGAASAIVLTNVDGFIANGNTFKSVTRSIFAFSVTKNGVVTGNIARTQSVGSTVLIFDASVSGGDQATTYIDASSNKILT